MKVIPQITRARLIPEDAAKDDLQKIEDALKDELNTLKQGSGQGAVK